MEIKIISEKGNKLEFEIDESVGFLNALKKELLNEIEQLEKDKVKNKLQIQVNKKTGSLPGRHEMGNILRYETAINRQMFQAINQLERLQRMRLGDHVPAPVQVDINTSGPEGLKLV